MWENETIFLKFTVAHLVPSTLVCWGQRWGDDFPHGEPPPPPAHLHLILSIHIQSTPYGVKVGCCSGHKITSTGWGEVTAYKGWNAAS